MLWYNTSKEEPAYASNDHIHVLSCANPLVFQLRSWCRLMALHRSTAFALLLVLTMGSVVTAQDTPGSNKQPFSFGSDQTIIDLNKLVWEPFKAEASHRGPS